MTFAALKFVGGLCSINFRFKVVVKSYMVIHVLLKNRNLTLKSNKRFQIF